MATVMYRTSPPARWLESTEGGDKKMNRETYDKLNNLVYRIDDLSRSADAVTEILSGFEKPGCSAKIFSYTDGKDYQTELTSNTAKKVFHDILKEYYAHIEEARSEINLIIDNLICE